MPGFFVTALHSRNHACGLIWNRGCSSRGISSVMIKATLMGLAAAGLVTGSYFGSTALGLRTEGWREVAVEVGQVPDYERVGQNLFAADGTRIILSSIQRVGGKYRVTAQVQVTERLALEPFQGRMARSYAMDRTSVERTVKEAVGVDPGRFEPSRKVWLAEG